MNRSILSIAITVMFLAPASARADSTCNSFKTANPDAKVPFCEDFDTYCFTYTGWPNTCPDTSNSSQTPMRQLWSNSSFNHNTKTYCGAEFALEEIQTIIPSPPYGGRSPNGGDEGGLLGQQTVDLITCQGQYNRTGNPDPDHHKCVPLALVYGNGISAVTGTDANPLVLTFAMTSGLSGANKFPWSTGYIELALDNDPPPVEGHFTPRSMNQAPLDYVWVGEPEAGGCSSCYGFCGNNNNGVHVPWRTICQQEFRRIDSPDACPPLDPQIRPVIALGAVAELDNNPCHCENVAGSQQPQNGHLSYFDGNKWRILKTGLPDAGPGSMGDFNLADKITSVSITIKSTTVDITLSNKKNDYNDVIYGLPRLYTGGFNKLRGGAATGCELDSSTHTCTDGVAGDKCLKQGGSRCDTGAFQAQNSGYVSFDNVLLFGGEGVSQTGSCCHSNGTCSEDLLPAECSGAGDIFGGPNSHCSTTTCCPHGTYSWADADVDGDVDADDFGAFQRCFTGSNPPNGVPASCACLDRVKVVPGIDVDDYNAFRQCESGAAVPWSPTAQCPAN